VDEEVAVVIKRTVIRDLNYGTTFRAKVPTAKTVARAMTEASIRWGTPALERKRSAGRARAAKYAWKRSASELLRVIENAYAKAA